ncbi:MAG TPA: hypothetical protein VHC41_10230 [Mycobacteriales bacterium]|nr:hypothetical protein [Mycobacteriales bacterium]
MIVRIMGEGQFELPDAEIDALNALDARLETLIHDRDESGFAEAFGALLERVRAHGTPVAADSLAPSDVVLPPVDSHLTDVEALLADDGLIPG